MLGEARFRCEKRIPISVVKDRISYNPETGIFVWRNGWRAGKEAGYVSPRGYRQIRISDNKGWIIMAHRMAWAIMTGEWPTDIIDHINRDSTDNRWSNLRIANQVINARNSKSKGICKCKQTGKWKAYLSIGGKQLWLGRHKTRLKALRARKEGMERFWDQY